MRFGGSRVVVGMVLAALIAGCSAGAAGTPQAADWTLRLLSYPGFYGG